MSKYPVVDVLQYPSYCLIWSRAQPFTPLFHKKRIFWSGYRVFEDDWMIHSFRIACQQQHEVAGQFVTSCIHPTWSPYQQSTCDGTLETAVEPYDVILYRALLVDETPFFLSNPICPKSMTMVYWAFEIGYIVSVLRAIFVYFFLYWTTRRNKSQLQRSFTMTGGLDEQMRTVTKRFWVFVPSIFSWASLHSPLARFILVCLPISLRSKPIGST